MCRSRVGSPNNAAHDHSWTWRQVTGFAFRLPSVSDILLASPSRAFCKRSSVTSRCQTMLDTAKFSVIRIAAGTVRPQQSEVTMHAWDSDRYGPTFVGFPAKRNDAKIGVKKHGYYRGSLSIFYRSLDRKCLSGVPNDAVRGCNVRARPMSGRYPRDVELNRPGHPRIASFAIAYRQHPR